jgi:hypothetical protein
VNGKTTFDRSGRPSVAALFRGQIEHHRAQGAEAAAMTLRLTYGDASRLKLDPAVPVADIAFSGGVMRFLGVKVVEGGVASSMLELEAG